MKIRMGFITNSSSTNFLIISKKELTSEYLYKKLGFKKGSPLEKQASALCDEIIRTINEDGIRYFDYDEPNFENIKEIFGEHSAKVFQDNPSFHVYWGYTSSDEEIMSFFFTMDSFEIEEKDFYINGKACTW